MLAPRKLNSSHAQFLETIKTHPRGNATCISHTQIQESFEIIINGYTAIYFRRNAISFGDSTAWDQYKRARNQANEAIKLARKLYVSDNLEINLR